MKLENYFLRDAKVLHTDATSKEEILKQIAAIATSSKTLQHINPDFLYQKFMEREMIGSTGFNDGIALPHCSLDNINDFVIGVLISKNGMDFQSVDGKPTKLFIFIVGPKNERNQHINILSEISKVLRVPSNVETLLEQKDVPSFFDQFCKYGSWDMDYEVPHEYSQVMVHVQDPSTFEDIIEIFTEIQGCHISIIEANNVSKYLYALPLFSQFTNQDSKGFHRVIIAVLNTVFVNNCIRSINKAVEKAGKTSRVMITSHALSYYNGSITI